MAEPTAFKYRAFLSYSHADTVWAKWLHRSLEGFRIDKDLVGRATAMGPVPNTLRPIFRDREDFSDGHSLTDATIAALDASAALVVLCSTVSGKSQYVNEEVRLFKSRHPDRPVIPVIIEGTPPENFSPALRFALEADGTVSSRPVTLLAPDVRESGDGKTLSLAKVIAGLTGLGTDEIVRRACRTCRVPYRGERDQRRRLRNWVAGLSSVVVALAGLTVWAEINRRDAVEQRQIADERRQEAERNFELAKGAADGLVFDIAQGLRDVEGMRASTVAKILGTARGTFDKLADAAPDNLELQRSRSVMLDEFANTYLTQGNLPAALASYQAYFAIADRLAKSDPGNAGWQRDLSVSYNKVGDVQVDQGNLPAALASYQGSLAIRDRLAKSDPGNAGWQAGLAASHGKLGNLLVAAGKPSEALAMFKRGRDIVAPLAARSEHVLWKQYLASFDQDIAALSK